MKPYLISILLILSANVASAIHVAKTEATISSCTGDCLKHESLVDNVKLLQSSADQAVVDQLRTRSTSECATSMSGVACGFNLALKDALESQAQLAVDAVGAPISPEARENIKETVLQLYPNMTGLIKFAYQSVFGDGSAINLENKSPQFGYAVGVLAGAIITGKVAATGVKALKAGKASALDVQPVLTEQKIGDFLARYEKDIMRGGDGPMGEYPHPSPVLKDGSALSSRSKPSVAANPIKLIDRNALKTVADDTMSFDPNEIFNYSSVELFALRRGLADLRRAQSVELPR